MLLDVAGNARLPEALITHIVQEGLQLGLCPGIDGEADEEGPHRLDQFLGQALRRGKSSGGIHLRAAEVKAWPIW